nr:unnamed protein product [Digitaria exilis]
MGPLSSYGRGLEPHPRRGGTGSGAGWSLADGGDVKGSVANWDLGGGGEECCRPGPRRRRTGALPAEKNSPGRASLPAEERRSPDRALTGGGEESRGLAFARRRRWVANWTRLRRRGGALAWPSPAEGRWIRLAEEEQGRGGAESLRGRG